MVIRELGCQCGGFLKLSVTSLHVPPLKYSEAEEEYTCIACGEKKYRIVMGVDRKFTPLRNESCLRRNDAKFVG